MPELWLCFEMNWEKSIISGFALWMEDYFFIKLGLWDVCDKFPVNYTYIHSNSISTSTIDRILVNEILLSSIEDD